MAFTAISPNASTTDKAGAGLSIALSGAVAIGDVIIVAVSIDSAVADTMANPPSDSFGNTYVQLGKVITGGAGTTANCGLWYARNGTAGTPTISFTGTSTFTATAMRVWCYSTSGGTISIVAGDSNTATGSSTGPSVAGGAGGTHASGDLVIGAIAYEGVPADVTAHDTDSTNGSWRGATTVGTTGGSAVTNVAIELDSKIVTGTTTQTFNVTLGTARDWSAAIATIRDVPPVVATVPPRFQMQVPAAKRGKPDQFITQWRTIPRPVYFDRDQNRVNVVPPVDRGKAGAVIAGFRTVPRPVYFDRAIHRARIVEHQRPIRTQPVKAIQPSFANRFVPPPPPDRFTNRAVVIDTAPTRHPGSVTSSFRTAPRPPYFDRVRRELVVNRASTHHPAGVITRYRTAPRPPYFDRFTNRARLIASTVPARAAAALVRTVRRTASVLNVSAYRWYYDNANPDSNTPRAAQNAALTLPIDDISTLMLRLLVSNVGGQENTDELVMQVRSNGGPWVDLDSNYLLTASSDTTSTPFIPATSRLTGGAGVFDAGDSLIDANTDRWSSQAIDPGEYMELGIYLREMWFGSVAPGDVLELRMFRLIGSTLLDADITQIQPTINVTVQSRLPGRPRTQIIGPAQPAHAGAVITSGLRPPQREVVVAPADRVVNRATVIDTDARRSISPAIATFRTAPRPPYFDRVTSRVTVAPAVAPAPRYQSAITAWRTTPRPQYFDRVVRAVVVSTEPSRSPGSVLAATLTAPRRFVVVVGDRVVNRALVVDVQTPRHAAAIIVSFRTTPRPPYFDAVRRVRYVGVAARQVSVGNITVGVLPRRRVAVERAKQRATVILSAPGRPSLSVQVRWRTIPRTPLIARWVRRDAVIGRPKHRSGAISLTGLTAPRRLVVVPGVRRIPHVALIGTAALARTAIMWLAWRGRTRINPPGPPSGSTTVVANHPNAKMTVPHSSTRHQRSAATPRTASGSGRTAMITGTGTTEAEQL